MLFLNVAIMEIYLVVCMVALVASLVLSVISGDLDMSLGNVVFLLVSAAMSWVVCCICSDAADYNVRLGSCAI